MLILKLILIPLATWRLYRLFALDSGPKNILHKIRVKLGVEYNGDKSKWKTNGGSLAEGLTCINCAPIWWGTLFTILFLFVPDWVFLLICLPLNASALAMMVENLVYAPRLKKK